MRIQTATDTAGSLIVAAASITVVVANCSPASA